MLNIEEISKLLSSFDKSNVDRMKFEFNDGKLVFEKKMNKKNVSEKFPEASKEENHLAHGIEQDLFIIESPMVGVFYSSPSSEDNTFVELGDVVKRNQQVGIVEAMKALHEVYTEVPGEILEIFVENGEIVEHGQPLFKVKRK